MTPSEMQVVTGQVSEAKRAAMKARTDALVDSYAARASTEAERRMAAFLKAAR